MALGDYSFVKDKVVKRMLDNFDTSSEAESDNRKRGLNAISFYRGGKSQWDTKIYERRYGKQPTESYNQIPKFIRQITNNMRQNKANTKVIPNTDGDIVVAEKLEDLLRAIQAQSQADVAYDMAGFNSTVNGWGYWRWLKEYENEDTFDQILKIGQIPNPFKIYDDPFCQRQDRLDRRYLIEVEDVKLSEFNKEEKKDYDSVDLQSIGDAAPDWATGKTVRRAEYWERTDIKSQLFRNKQSGEITEVKPEDVNNYDTRDVITPKITWYKCTAMEVLETKTWDGVYIPYVFVAGETVYEDGKIYYSGAVEPMIPPQKLYNYAANAIVEAVSSQPLSPFIAAVGQIDGKLARFWDNMNTDNTAWLPYNPVTVNGQIAPPPSRMQQSADITSLVNVLEMAQTGFNEASGQYQANIGAASGEKSGIAIQRRNQQSETSTFHFPDNLARALTANGIIYLDLVQKTYDGSREVKFLKEDKTDYSEKINQPTQDENGQETTIDFTVGTYDIMIDVGAGYTTKRQEGADAMIQLAQSTNLMEVAPDIVYREQDWPGAQEIADRYKKLLPPQLQDSPNMKDVPPEVQTKMAQMAALIQQAQQQIQALSGQLQQCEQELQSKQAEYATKMAGIQKDSQNDAAKAQNDTLKLQIDRQKLILEKQKLDLEQAHFLMTQLQSQQPQEEEQAAPQQDTMPANLGKNARAGHLQDIQAAQDQIEMDNQLKVTTLQQQGEGINMLSQMLQGIKASLDANNLTTQALIESVNAPKTASKSSNGEWTVAPINATIN